MFARALLCLALMPTLQGCLLTRVMDTRSQLCDEQPPAVIVVQESGRDLRVVFEKPTLTEQDVISMIGFEPTQTGGGGAVRTLSYEARPLHRPFDRATGLVLRLSFVRGQGEYKLSEVQIPEQFNAILPPTLLDAAVKVACRSKISAVPPQSTFDLTPVDRATLPDRDALRKLLGPPAGSLPRVDEIAYLYCLVPCEARPDAVASLRFSFGVDGELLHAEASYFRYSATVDLASSRPTATIGLH